MRAAAMPVYQQPPTDWLRQPVRARQPLDAGEGHPSRSAIIAAVLIRHKLLLDWRWPVPV